MNFVRFGKSYLNLDTVTYIDRDHEDEDGKTTFYFISGGNIVATLSDFGVGLFATLCKDTTTREEITCSTND